jgi:hypothetical protein
MITVTSVEAHNRSGKRVSEAGMRQLNIQRHKTCPNWHYTFKPRPAEAQARANAG